MSQERHYPWDVLEIDETDNKKLIKKAYAVLIKQYKPDEFPEKFQEIQEAYQFALGLSRTSIWQKESGNTFSESIIVKSENNNTGQDGIIDTNDEKTANKLIKHLSKILSYEQKDIDLMRNWVEFKLFNSILDIQLKKNLSNQIFEVIAQFNLKYQDDKSRPIIHLSTIGYLDEIFDWSTNWQDLLNQFPYEYIEVTLQRAEKKIDFDKFVTPIISRGLGFYLDYLTAVLVVFIIKWVSLKYLTVSYEEKTLSYLLITFFFLQRIFMESLMSSRRSIGKVVRGLYIVDLNGLYINFKKSLHRHYLIALNLTPYFLYLFKVKFDELIYFAMIITIIATNLTSYFIKGCLLHDLINRTRVLNSE